MIDKTPEQLELERAENLLAEAKAKVAALDAVRLQKAQVELAQRLADEQKRLMDQQAEQRRIEEYHAQKRREREQAEAAERRAEEQGRRELEQKIAREEEAARLKKLHEERLRKIDEDRHAQEVEAAQIASELARVKVAETVQFLDTPSSFDETSGRARLFSQLGIQDRIDAAERSGTEGNQQRTAFTPTTVSLETVLPLAVNPTPALHPQAFEPLTLPSRPALRQPVAGDSKSGRQI
jgi:hypothetical protein